MVSYRVSSSFIQKLELLCSSPADLQCQMPWELLFPVPGWGTQCGVRNSHSCGREPLRYSYFPVCGSSPGMYRIACIAEAPRLLSSWASSLSLSIGCLFWWLPVYFVDVQQLVVVLVFLWEAVSLYPSILPSCLLQSATFNFLISALLF